MMFEVAKKVTDDLLLWDGWVEFSMSPAWQRFPAGGLQVKVSFLREARLHRDMLTN